MVFECSGTLTAYRTTPESILNSIEQIVLFLELNGRNADARDMLRTVERLEQKVKKITLKN